QKEEPLKDLLLRIREETDAIKYTDLAVRIKEKADVLLLEKKFDEAFPALLVFLDHASPLSGLSNDIRSTAIDKLTSFLTAETLKYVIGKVSVKGEEHGSAQHMLLRGGDQSIELLLGALIEAPDAVSRRNLFNTALMFGKKIIPHVEKYFTSDQWYVVRQMVSLLGELGDPASIDAIITAYGHPDIRIKKEALKSLSRIQSPMSNGFLLKALEETDPSLMTQAVISLGMLRDPLAVEPIARIALKWEPFSENQEPKKEAIKALGIIGDGKAVPCLAKVLSRKAWFGKKINEEVRLLAANALGMIQGPEADEALRAASGGSSGEIHNVCKRILEGREKKAI
ncbi:MAG: HEAT repeat domain-containing protein, partial [Deltaproteobacteria bacterium]|nr:HEAT repeat domain-containing protein [Deltaproteobacteria bacterium]